MAERETALGTLAVAAGIALFCSLLVSTAVYLLRPMQLAYAEIDRNRAIVEAAGLVARGAPEAERAIVAAFVDLEPRLFDRQTGRFSTELDALGYDYRAASENPAQSTAVSPERDLAGVGRQARYLLIHESKDSGRIVLPIHGRGMWSTIYGYLCLEADLETIAGISFYEHGETAGIGDRIEGAAWQTSWRGKRPYADDGSVALRIAAADGGVSPEHRVDAITGATVTATAVERMVRFWLGPDGFAPALAELAEERDP